MGPTYVVSGEMGRGYSKPMTEGTMYGTLKDTISVVVFGHFIAL